MEQLNIQPNMSTEVDTDEPFEQTGWGASQKIAHEVDHVINSQEVHDAIEKLKKAIFSLI